MTETTTPVTTLTVGEKVEKLLVPLHCNGSGKNMYGQEVWHVHFDDLQMNHYYLMTTSESTVKKVMSHVNSAVKVKFIVAGIREFENCVRIKNVSFK